MFSWLQIILMIIQSVLAALVGYLLLLTGAAWQASRRLRPSQSDQPTCRFGIVIPAHNEEQLLPDLLKNLAQLEYPRSLYVVHVIADNCTDQTAVVARRAGAVVHERVNEHERGKGYALQWLLQRLWDAGEPHDALVILDADTLVSPNFLQAMAARLARGERVIQAYYAVRDPDRSWSVSLRYAALAVLHYLRPLGRMALGGSAGLKGNGMVFTADVMRRHQWSASLTEDIEFHMALILEGERVTFAPEAVVWAEMPASLAGAQTQNERWERGRLQMARRYLPRLLRAAWQERGQQQKGRCFLLLDAAMEHVIPPFSLLAGMSVACLLGNFVLGQAGHLEWKATQPAITRYAWSGGLPKANLLLGIGLLLGQLAYLLAGLGLARAPKVVYQALLYAPVFVVWKIWHYMRILLGQEQHGWLRTARSNEVS